jgi:hypothetical protein
MKTELLGDKIEFLRCEEKTQGVKREIFFKKTPLQKAITQPNTSDPQDLNHLRTNIQKSYNRKEKK